MAIGLARFKRRLGEGLRKVRTLAERERTVLPTWACTEGECRCDLKTVRHKKRPIRPKIGGKGTSQQEGGGGLILSQKPKKEKRKI